MRGNWLEVTGSKHHLLESDARRIVPVTPCSAALFAIKTFCDGGVISPSLASISPSPNEFQLCTSPALCSKVLLDQEDRYI